MYAYPLPTPGFVEPLPATPKYQGVSRRKTPSERLLDDLYAAGDLEGTIEAIVEHCSAKYPRGIYKTFGDPNHPLAGRVAFDVLRALPAYDGPAEKMEPFDATRVPLSSYVNLVAKCRHLDLTREWIAVKQNEVLACELIKAGEDYDVLAFISDVKQTAGSHLVEGQSGQRYKLYDPEVRLIVAQTISRLSPIDRSVIRACNLAGFATGKDFRRVERKLRRLGLGWHSRSRKYDMAAVRRTVHNAGGLLAIYQDQ
jgi:hypothetical protein